MTDSVKFILDENEIPKSWYNIVSDLPEPPAPVIHPGTVSYTHLRAHET